MTIPHSGDGKEFFTPTNPGYTTLAGSNVMVGDDPRGLVPISELTILTTPTYDGSGQAVHPSVVFIPEGFGGYKFWMALTPYPFADATKENPSILASNNGVTWIVPPGLTNPVVPPPGVSNNSDPHLEYDKKNALLVMYYQYNGDGSKYRVTSSDGVTWSAATLVVGDIGTSSSVIKYSDLNDRWIAISASTKKLFRKESTDGVTFSNPVFIDLPIPGQTGHAWFGVDDLGWHALVSVAPRNKLWGNSNLYYAFSNNGYDWRLFPSPVLGKTIGGNRDLAVYRSSMVNIGDVVRVYTSIRAADNSWHIAYIDCKFAFNDARQYKGTTAFHVYNKVQIRDITATYGFYDNPYDEAFFHAWNKYKHKALTYINSLNQPVTLNWVTNYRGDLAMQGGTDILMRYNAGTPQTMAYSLPAADAFSPVLITEADMPILGQKALGQMAAYVKAAIAPTTGDFSMSIIMWND